MKGPKVSSKDLGGFRPVLEALVEFDVRFHHHPLELEQQGGLPGVVVRSEPLLWALAKPKRPHLLLMLPSNGCGGRRTLSNKYKWRRGARRVLHIIRATTLDHDGRDGQWCCLDWF